MKFAIFLPSLVAASAFAAPSFSSQYELDGGSGRHGNGNTIIDKLRDHRQFSKFVEVLEREKGLRDELESSREATVFAPTNEAFKRLEDDMRERDQKIDMRDVLRYHIAPKSQIACRDMHAGALIPTDLRLKSLDDRHQRIRVFKFADTVWLNMQSQVVESLKADNGHIHAIDHVLCPPKVVTETMYAVPFKFSTTISGLERTGLMREVERERGITFFAPTNNAWKALGPDNLRWLFSCWGQTSGGSDSGRSSDEDQNTKCEGTKTLKKILANHVAREMAYSCDIVDKQKMSLDTLGGQKIEVCAKEKTGRSGRGSWGGSEHKDVRNWNFVVNNGEARITFTDGLGSNGAIQAIDNVLVGNCKLPFDRFGA